MKKIIRVVLLTCVLLSLTNPMAGAAASFTTGFTFTLPDSFPLHNVYVGVQASTDPVRPEDVLLAGNPALVGGAVTPHGFDVPVGNSAFDLNSLLDVSADRWAVIGLFTDAGGVNHVVVGTNADLTGVPLNFPLIPVTFDEADLISALTTGVGLLAEGGIVETLADNGFMRAFGDTAQLFFFSNGQPIPGGSATANAFGVPLQQAVPEPSLLLLLASGLLGLLAYRSRPT